jgi:hypothetical protein
MEVLSVRSFFVHPSKNETKSKKVTSTLVPKGNQVFSMMEALFQKSDKECVINVVLTPTKDGKQKNAFKELLINYSKNQNEFNGLKIAEALQCVTTHKSGLGLLFLLHGSENGKTKLVLSRFAADEGISATETKDKLSVEFVKNIFMKNALTYKSAMFEGSANLTHITGGKAIDKQMNGHGDNIAHYWITHFLQCSLQTTAATGSNRLATRIKDAISFSKNADVKSEIIAAASLLKNVNAQPLSGELFCKQYTLSADAKEIVKKAFKSDVLFTESFIFDATEFEKVLSYKSMELSNGALISANAFLFNDVFIVKRSKNDDSVHVTTFGKIVNENLSKKGAQ